MVQGIPMMIWILNKAEEILNEDHFGLRNPRNAYLEYLAVQKLVKKLKGPILCLVGPPGVGKTSIARSIAVPWAESLYVFRLAGLEMKRRFAAIVVRMLGLCQDGLSKG